MTIEEWLAAWDAEEPERVRIAALFEDAHNGNTAAMYKADEAAADLRERQSDLAEGAEKILRELHKNSTLPEHAWFHLDGEVCTFDTSKVILSQGETVRAEQGVVAVGFCDEHDRRVYYR